VRSSLVQQLSCCSQNGHSQEEVDHSQEELEPRGLSQGCDGVGLNEMRWVSLLTWGSAMEAHSLCSGDRQGG